MWNVPKVDVSLWNHWILATLSKRGQKPKNAARPTRGREKRKKSINSPGMDSIWHNTTEHRLEFLRNTYWKVSMPTVRSLDAPDF